MTKKQQLIKLNNEFDSNLLIKDIKNKIIYRWRCR